MSGNPFEAPLSDLNPETDRDAIHLGEVWVDGKQLVVRSNTVLPPFCIKTNEPIPESELIKKTLTWLPPAYALVLLLGGPLLLLIVYLLVRKQCVLTYGIASSIRRKRRNRILLNCVISLLLFLAIPLTAPLKSPVPMVTALLAFIGSIVSLLLMGSQLRITKHRKGEFWISGCSADFLARFEAQPNSSDGFEP
ncbi:hypothetical protein [Schlesneria paludicola]|uniref:hypothetical protein n=1 Tax=Schlesneria paludicola TaxID=360056 RepID=UPI00029B0B82|nr:hypothetical protein [Schlesneria paludicola]